MGKIIRRILTIIPAVALQSLWLLLLMKWLTPYAPIIVSLLSVAAFFLVVFIIIKRDETAYKLLWLLVILSLPLVGALLYLLFGNKRTARPLKRRLQQVQKSCNPQPLPIKEAPFDGEKRMGQTVRWLEEKTQYPMCVLPSPELPYKNRGLYACAGDSATARDAACAIRLLLPTTKESNTYFGFRFLASSFSAGFSAARLWRLPAFCSSSVVIISPLRGPLSSLP